MNSSKQDRNYFFILLFVLVITSFVVILFYGAKENAYVELKDKERKQIKIVQENKNILKEEEVSIKRADLQKVLEESNEVLESLLKWDSWEEYVIKRENVSSKFPELRKVSEIDLKGNDVGTGKSPKSRYVIKETLTCNKPRAVAYVVEQDLDYESSYAKNSFYFTFELTSDGDLLINDFDGLLQ
ncbi:hypothetical protein [Listeria welshimeri]|uniref:hypothetical protein n=1 Tax=Listeria welshimeri TaxID=1643 RepID=UPI001629D96D|nr:hypothetical protein [Listeria welshimeri]MBC1705815.1 hypothetical protein [Listeria welshimeri]MBF2342571.1 hypothetical protein [Listeria welshimeri]